MNRNLKLHLLIRYIRDRVRNYARYAGMLIALIAAVMATSTPIMGANAPWMAYTREGDSIVNGLSSDSQEADAPGELSVQFDQSGSGQTEFGSVKTRAETSVGHLSQVQFDPTREMTSSPAGDTVVIPVEIQNKGNGPDTYMLSGSLDRGQDDWDTGIFMDNNGNSKLDTNVDMPVRALSIPYKGSKSVLFSVHIPDTEMPGSPDTFTVTTKSIRTEDPEPGQDTAFFKVAPDTSRVIARNIHDTGNTETTLQQQIELSFKPFKKADTIQLTSTDTGSARVDFRDTIPWKLSTLGGTHTVDAKYIYEDGTMSDTVSDTIFFKGGVPELLLNKDVYRGIRDKAKVTVRDSGADKNVEIHLTSDVDQEGLRLTLTESSDGEFKGAFRFTEGLTREDMIAVSIGSQVQATYISDGETITKFVEWKQKQGTANSVDDVRTWPNPFDPTSGKPLVFQNLPADQGLSIMIYNINSQLVRELTLGDGIQFNPSGNTGKWFGRNVEQYIVSSGTYIYVIDSQYGSKKGKITVIK